MFFDQHFFVTKNVFGPTIFQLKFWFGLGKLGFGFILIFLRPTFFNQIFGNKNFLGSKFLLGPTVFGTKILGINFIWGPNYIF